jgi:hypothetical protein
MSPPLLLLLLSHDVHSGITMPFRNPGLQYLLCLLGMVVSKSLASETPSTVQFDLVFPKNNTIYEPTYPSPLVVAIHNASALKQHTVYWSWNITESPYWPTEETPKIIASGMSRPHAILENVMEQTQLIIEPISALFNNTADLLALRYSFDVTHACDVPSFSSTVVVFEGETTSKCPANYLTRSPAIIPMLGSRLNCSVSIGAIGVQNLGQREDACPVINPGAQVPRNCSVSIDEKVEDQVSAIMEKAVGCPEKTWEGTVGMMVNCQSSGSGRIASAGLVTVAALLFGVMVS